MDDHVALKGATTVVLAILSAIFSGLNLGLMCLDTNQLILLVKAAERDGADKEARRQAAWAARILPLRKDGNLLLCTVLLGNVMVNSYFAILLAEFWDGTAAFVVSTLVIVTFGEIMPQSICYKHGLRIGAALVPLLIFFWYLLFPISKPMALILDQIFGEEIGQVLDRQQFLTLIEYQRKQAPHLLTEQEAKILRGSMDFATMMAKNIMVPMADCFCLDACAVINPGLCAAVAAAGFSRIPVIDRDPLSPKRQFAVIGLIHVKDLLLLEIDHEVPLKALLPLIGRQVFIVDDDRPLLQLLEEFRRGASQLAVVRGIVDDEDCDPYFRHVGILTLQDLLNTIVQEDVHEVDADDVDSCVSSEPSGMFSNVRRFHECLDTTVDHRSPVARAHNKQMVQGLSKDEVIAAAAFLRQRYPQLFRQISQTRLEAFLLRSRVVGEADALLFERLTPAPCAALVIAGEVKVFAGAEAHECILGPWSLLGKRCLEEAKSSKSRYIPDFTARMAEAKDNVGASRILLISGEAYGNLLSNSMSL
ncbi:unnamed protein product [Effrenium voratum]|uniref:CNNM transmembrane domain-containing protein n=1 Tax=Effrenium voratum TaxID=2562239 RepID=A0AA36NCL0_9DINO|nr:unnamed protein product [Effrenium voratum]